MVTIPVWIFGSVFIVSLISLVGVFTLSLSISFLRSILFLLVSLAAGALFGDAFLHLLPEVFGSDVSPLLVSSFVLAGLMSFFILEKFLRWHHSHGEDEFSPDHAHIHPVGHLVIVGDVLHNFVDGLVIGASYFISIEIGIATTLAIVLHEIPQEIGDFGLLIHAGFSRMWALLANFFSALIAFLGAFLAFSFQGSNEVVITLVAAFAAGNFIYIAGSDLVPELHKTVGLRQSLLQFSFIALGLLLMALLLLSE